MERGDAPGLWRSVSPEAADQEGSVGGTSLGKEGPNQRLSPSALLRSE